MTKPASADSLGELHSAVANALTDIVANGVTVVTEGKAVKVPASPAYLAAAITFLKNNNITAGTGNSDLDALKRALDSKRTARAPISPQALDEAAELFGQRIQ